jgi:uncharacterized iron-regulated membrane protein
MSRLLFLLHRYLGIAACLLVAMWCVSGIVMMYVAYPSFSPRERIQRLPPLNWEGCCRFEQALAAAGEQPIESFEIEMLGDAPVLRFMTAFGAQITLDLATGEQVGRVSEELARRVAQEYSSAPGVPILIARDQWTVSGAFNRDRPLYRVPLNDAASTEIYVSSRAGKVVQDTTRTERFWNWPGAVMHWLYPTVLRQHAETWSQVVIWTSLLGIVLTVTGLYLGIKHLDTRGSRLSSPYRGLRWWHHILGLVFGLLTFTWLLSGLFSMTPWGLLESEGAFREKRRMENISLDVQQAIDVARRLAEADMKDIVHVASAPLDGKLFLNVSTRETVARFDAETLAPAPLERETIEALAKNLRPDASIASLGWLTEPEAYYYASHNYGEREFPVLRVLFEDEQQTRYYLSARDGSILQKSDSNARWSRWLFEGLHRFDFSATLRQRPLWDVIVLTLMLGVTALALTGVYLSWRHLKRRV